MVFANIDSRVLNDKTHADLTPWWLHVTILSRLIGKISISKIDVDRFKVLAELKLADPFYGKLQKIDAILGSEVFFDLLCSHRLKVISSGLIM